ncbi:MAG: AI-2E family transporter [Alphaproteobacteria bacterium]|nr:AI-2E family transporter [Rickettsiales bacterium]
MITESTRKKFTKEKLLFFTFVSLALFFFATVSNILPPFIFAFIVAYTAEPLATRMEKLGVNRSLASLLLTIVLICLISLVLFFSLPFIAKQIVSLIKNIKGTAVWINTDAKVEAVVFKTFPNLDHELRSVLTQGFIMALNFINNSFESIGEIALSVFKGFGDLAIMLFSPILTYYMIKDWNRILKGIKVLIPKRYLRGVLRVMRSVDSGIYMYFKGQLKVSAALVLVYSVLLYFTSLKSGAILGVIMGVCTIVPYVGFAFMALITILISFQEFGGQYAEIMQVITALLVGHIIDSGFITPKLMGESVDISPVWLIFGVLGCSSVFGLIGAFLGLPILVIVSTLVRHSIFVYRGSAFYGSNNL